MYRYMEGAGLGTMGGRKFHSLPDRKKAKGKGNSKKQPAVFVGKD